MLDFVSKTFGFNLAYFTIISDIASSYRGHTLFVCIMPIANTVRAAAARLTISLEHIDALLVTTRQKIVELAVAAILVVSQQSKKQHARRIF